MNNTREKFEEIWPVPEGVYWCDLNGCYVTRNVQMMHRATDHDLRLDTFTRCHETTLDIERALSGMLFAFDDGVGREWSEDLLDYARKLVAAKEYVK